MCWPWFEIAVICGITAFGQIFFAHFEERTPKARKVVKLFAVNLLAIALSAYFGRSGLYAFLGLALLALVVVHGWWLPSKGINGLTGEPKKRYYQLRGWK